MRSADHQHLFITERCEPFRELGWSFIGELKLAGDCIPSVFFWRSRHNYDELIRRRFERIEVERPAAHDNQRTLIPRFLEISLVFPRRPSHDVRITPLRDLSVKRGNKNSNSLHAIWGCSLWYRNNGVPETKRAGKTTEAGSYHKLLVLYS